MSDLVFDRLEETQVSATENDKSGQLDDDFEQQKKMIEDELRLIEEQNRALQEQENDMDQRCGDVASGTEEMSTNETYDELTDRLLKVAHSIQESAKSLGKEEIDLSPRIEKIQLLKDECQVANQSIQAKDNSDKKVTAQKKEKHNQENIKSDTDQNIFVEQNGTSQLTEEPLNDIKPSNKEKPGKDKHVKNLSLDAIKQKIIGALT